MNDLCKISVTCTPEVALKKLSKEKIALFNLKIKENCLNFEVKSESLKKVFAIFKHPCYNIRIVKQSSKNKLKNFAINRIGLFIGLAVFLASIALSDSFILKIEVTGSGSFLENQVLEILAEAGATAGCRYARLDKPLAQSQILALSGVTFCSIEKQGSVLVVDVQADGQNQLSVMRKPLYSDESGRVVELVAACGTPAVNVGDYVESGDCIIAPYFVSEDGTVTDCIVAGFAWLECEKTISVAADCESEENEAYALHSTLLYTDSVLKSQVSVKLNDNTVIYEVTFSFLHLVSINMQ
jgi:hypothetical protein